MPDYVVILWICGLTVMMCLSTIMDCLSKNKETNDRIVIKKPVVSHNYELSISNEYEDIEDFDL